MEIFQKQRIAERLEAYMTEHQLSQADVSKITGVNAYYIQNIRKWDFTIKSGDNTIDIAPKYFKRLADFVGADPEKEYWETKETPQMKRMINALNEAKELSNTCLIIGETGSGKTYVLEKFKRKHPKDVFTLKVGHSDRINDLILKAMETLQIEPKHSSLSSKMTAIVSKLKKISEDGGDPMLIFDEAEYMKQPALCAMKEFYDNLIGVASIVLIGTSQLTREIERLKKKDKQGIPQLVRRIKYNVITLPPIDRSYKDFVSDIKDLELRKWLTRNCENYGELHDVLVKARKCSDDIGKPLSIDLVRALLKID